MIQLVHDEFKNRKYEKYFLVEQLTIDKIRKYTEYVMKGIKRRIFFKQKSYHQHIFLFNFKYKESY